MATYKTKFTSDLSTAAQKVTAAKKTVTSKKSTKSAKKKANRKKAEVSPFGSFGKLISFTTSDKKILTFTGFKREGDARWKEHSLIGKKPRKQFLGPGTDTVTFSIVLDARHGVKPRDTLSEIIKHRDKGKADYLVINGNKVCSNKMVITKTSDTWDEVWNKGELVRATIEITLEEYAG